MKFRKRFLSLALVFLLCLGMLPIGAASSDEMGEEVGMIEPQEETSPEDDMNESEPPAEDEENPTEPEEFTAEEPLEEIAPEPAQDGATASGTCGNGLTWTLKSGVLTIKGRGEMENFTSVNHWGGYDRTITSVVIKDGVTSIGEYAFYNCTSLTRISIPDSVTSIGARSFMNCTSLTGIDIPDSVTSIGACAFYGCTSLVRVVIPDGVTLISAGAFEDCTSLTSISIPDSVTIIGDMAFLNCTKLTSIVIPGSVTSIGTYAFSYCSKLTSISIPDSVTSIGACAFSYCSKLTSISIPDSVTSIGVGAFAYCTSLTSISIPDSVTSIGDSAFEGCSSLVEVTVLAPNCWISSTSKTLGSKNKTTIYGYKGSTAQTYAEKNGFAFEVLNDQALEEDDVLCSGTCGNNLSWMLTDEGVLTISGTGKMTDYDDASQVPWNEYRERIEKVIVGEGVLNIGSYAFQDCENLVEVSLPEGVRQVGGYAFDNTAIRKLTVPGSLNTVTLFSFYGCTKLETLILSEGIETIDMGAFQECSAIQNITFPSTLKSIWAGTFSDTPWREKQGMLVVVNGILFDYDEDKNDNYDVIVPADVDGIEYGVFLRGQLLDSVTILNPDCEVPDYEIRDTVVYGYRNSTAEKYVEEFGDECNVTFVALDAVQLGNINGDDTIDLKDVTLLFQFVNGQIDALDNESVADVNDDDTIDLKDVTKLFQLVNGQIDTL